jgi:hypothetical protein
VVVISVLGDALLAALRRLAKETLTAQRLGSRRGAVTAGPKRGAERGATPRSKLPEAITRQTLQ